MIFSLSASLQHKKMQFLVKIYTFASYETIINSYVWMRAYRHSLQVFVIVFKEGKSGIGIKKQKKTFLSGEKEEREEILSPPANMEA